VRQIQELRILSHPFAAGRGNLHLFDLSDPRIGADLPGCYHFELDGMTVAVPGPWELGWNQQEP
jgi:hypothetical protein